MTAVEIVTVAAAIAAALASIAASAIGVINALNGAKTHAMVNSLSSRATQLERADASTTGYAAGVQAEHQRQSSTDPPRAGYREGDPPSRYR
jgi:Tfp pilus assembly protein PilE